MRGAALKPLPAGEARSAMAPFQAGQRIVCHVENDSLKSSRYLGSAAGSGAPLGAAAGAGSGGAAARQRSPAAWRAATSPLGPPAARWATRPGTGTSFVV
jgi:hypothetical protein